MISEMVHKLLYSDHDHDLHQQKKERGSVSKGSWIHDDVLRHFGSCPTCSKLLRAIFRARGQDFHFVSVGDAPPKDRT
jgi:hypothetical protein